MKTLKAKLIMALILFSLILVPVIQSCKKYPEGPGFSVRSRKERVTNTWKVENYKVNDRDFTSLTSDYSETFTKNGGYAYWWGSMSGSGKWAFQNNDEEILLIGTDNQSSHTLHILRLEEEQFWYYYMVGSEKHEFHMIEK